MQKSANQRQITIAEMAPHVHNFRLGESKADKITDWLTEWIKTSLKNGKVKPMDFLPAKGDLAFHIGVSLGTVQNVFRRLENAGLVESRQKIGTYIKPKNSSDKLIKLTSKREVVVDNIKKYIIDNNYNIGSALPPSRDLARELNFSVTTVQTAVKTIVQEGFLEKKQNKFIVKNKNFSIKNTEAKTLVDKIAEQLKTYINKNYSVGEKIPPSTELASKFNTSIKSIYDAVRVLEKSGLVITKRGKYGTIVAGDASDNLYFYEKIELKLKYYISENCEIGDKLPSIKAFAEQLNVSTKTVKYALDNLAEDGYITFSRGRNGGTFVTDIPQSVDKTYTWLALNPDFIFNIEKPSET